MTKNWRVCWYNCKPQRQVPRLWGFYAPLSSQLSQNLFRDFSSARCLSPNQNARNVAAYQEDPLATGKQQRILYKRPLINISPRKYLRDLWSTQVSMYLGNSPTITYWHCQLITRKNSSPFEIRGVRLHFEVLDILRIEEVCFIHHLWCDGGRLLWSVEKIPSKSLWSTFVCEKEKKGGGYRK